MVLCRHKKTTKLSIWLGSRGWLPPAYAGRCAQYWPPDHARRCAAGRGGATVQACSPLPGNAPAVATLHLVRLRSGHQCRRAGRSRWGHQCGRAKRSRWGHQCHGAGRSQCWPPNHAGRCAAVGVMPQCRRVPHYPAMRQRLRPCTWCAQVGGISARVPGAHVGGISSAGPGGHSAGAGHQLTPGSAQRVEVRSLVRLDLIRPAIH